MSNIFAGLEDLGFKNVEKVDVYQESDSEKKKQEAAKQDAKKETNEEDNGLTSDAKCNSVVHPNHYNSGKYECIEVMREVFGEEAVKLFCAMNAFKYLWRYNKKNGEEDVAKACNYLKIRSGLNKTEE